MLNTSYLLKYLILHQNKFKYEDIAAFSQKYLSDGLIEIALNVANDTGIDKFALSGGVFVNEFITSYISKTLQKEDYIVLRNENVPPGDGGSALGQAVSALHHVI